MTPNHETKAVALLDPNAMRRLFNHRLYSHEWWIFIARATVDLAEVTGLLREVETKFYSGPANADFEILVHTGVAFFFARKSRMSAEQLSAVLRQPVEALKARHVLILTSGRESEEAVMEYIAALDFWTKTKETLG